MHRSKKIIYTAHCILNQNSVIRDWERAKGAFNDIVRVLLDKSISIVQLPCPEFLFLGEDRPAMTKEEYDTEEYRTVCKDLVINIINQMKEYVQNGYDIIGLLGIEASPSCDTLGNKGIFMEELQGLLTVEDIQLSSFDIPEDYIEGKNMDTILEFKEFVKNNAGEL